jgi:hypothetical protein
MVNVEVVANIDVIELHGQVFVVAPCRMLLAKAGAQVIDFTV